MTIETLREQMMTAMKVGNKFTKEVLSSVLSTAKNMAIEKGCKDNISEDIVNRAILKELKTANEMLDTCPSDRLEQLEEFTLRIEILKEIAPQMMDKEEIINFIKEVAGENNIEDIKEDKMDNNTLQINMNNLTDEERNTLLSLVKKSNEPKSKKSKVWKPQEGDDFCTIYGDGNIYTLTWTINKDRVERYEIGNCFKTEEEAKFAVERLKIITELKRFAIEHNEGEIDWNDNNQYKYILCFDHDENCVNIDMFTWVQYQHAYIYFTSREIAEQAIKKIGKERLKKYYFEVND